MDPAQHIFFPIWIPLATKPATKSRGLRPNKNVRTASKPTKDVRRIVKLAADIRTASKPVADVWTVSKPATDTMGIVKPTPDLRMALKPATDVRRAALEQPSKRVENISLHKNILIHVQMYYEMKCNYTIPILLS